MAPQVRTVPRKKPTQDRSKATVEAILAATARVLTEDGYDRASTNRVALRAGVSVGSLYQYFPTKEALVAALIDRHVKQMQQVLMDKLATLPESTPEKVVADVVEAMVAAHEVDPKLHGVLTEQIPRIGRLQNVVEINRDMGQLIRGYMEMLGDKIVPKNLDAAVFILVASVEAVTHAMVIDRKAAANRQAVVEELTALICRYLFKPAR